MHATIPTLPHGVHHILKSGTTTGELDGQLAGLLDRTSGKILANGMAVLIKLGFGFLVSEGLSENQAEKAQAFFAEDFVIRDPNVEGGLRYYQGKFLIRTRKAEDDMNVWVKFCPNPEALYTQTPLGLRLNPTAIVSTEAITEEEADRIERDQEQVDLVIRFRDIEAILGLVGRPDADIVSLLLENLVQLTGNFGHLFKFGAIGKNVELALTQPS